MTTFRINRVYTRSGDEGDTGLVGGDRITKASPQVECYGEIDELNSCLGAAICHAGGNAAICETLQFIQQELFDIGSEIATKSGASYPGMWRAGTAEVERLELLCDRFSEPLSELTSFILPGGSELASALHLSRTVARRAERSLVRYRDGLRAAGEELNPFLLKYVNRLSDLLFVLARRSLHDEGKTAPLWQPDRERKLPV